MANLFQEGMTFGLTGGIACGKSTVTKTLREFSIPIVDADQVARQVVEPDTIGWGCMRALFGSECLNADRTLNRAKIGSIVFSNKDKMMVLNAIMAPLIADESKKQLTVLRKQYRIVGYDAALILEQGDADKYRPLIVVACPLATQLERLLKRSQKIGQPLTEEQAMARINMQMSTADKIKLADFVIETDGLIEDSVAQTKVVIQQLHEMVNP